MSSILKIKQHKFILGFFSKDLLKKKKKIELVGNSLEIQWLGLGAFTTKVWVQPLVGELRYHKPHDVAKNGGGGKEVSFIDKLKA